MSTDTVYSALQAAIQTRPGGATYIDLWAAANGSQALQGLVPILELFGISNSYEADTPRLSRFSQDTGLSMAATGTFGQPGARQSQNLYPVDVTLQYSQSGDSFTLTLRVSSGQWRFSNFFLELPDTLMEKPSEGLGIRWYPSYLKDFSMQGVAFSARSGAAEQLHLDGFLLEPIAEISDRMPMIAPWPLRLTGTVVMPSGAQTYPLLDLIATSSSPNNIGAGKESGLDDGPAAFSLSGIALNLVVARQDPPILGNDAFSSLELFGAFSLAGISGRASTLILSTGQTWTFALRFSKDTTPVQGLAQLTGFFGVELPIPMNFPVLSSFYLAEVDIDLLNTANAGEFPSFTLRSLGLTITSRESWTPPVPFIRIDKVGIRWVWSATVVQDQGVQKKTYSMGGMVFGAIHLGPTGANGGAGLALPPSGNGGGGSLMLAGNPPAPSVSGEVLLADKTALTTEAWPGCSLLFKLSLPNFLISGSLKSGDYIPIGDAFAYFFGQAGPAGGLQKMNVVKLRVNADPIGQYYSAEAGILFGDPSSPASEQGWTIDLGITSITVLQVGFSIEMLNGKLSGGINGVVYFGSNTDPSDYTLPRLVLSAEYPQQDPSAPEGWTLKGALVPGTSIDLVQLIKSYIYGSHGTITDWEKAFKLTVDQLAVSYTTGSSGPPLVKPSYSFKGAMSARWQPNIFGTTVTISASVTLEMNKPSTSDSSSGSLTCSFAVNKLSVTAALTFGVPEPTYRFRVQYDQLWFQAVTGWRTGADKTRHQVISLQLGGVTLGDVLEYLVNLAAPTLGFQLDSPWDVLKRIDLSSFVLTIDPTENVVELVYLANVDMVVMRIDSVGVRYDRNASQSGVSLILTGNFLGKAYGDDKPLSWDVVNDPPPSVPGKGTALLDLRYLGVGQRVTFEAAKLPDTVAESVALLRQSMKPAQPGKNPLDGQGMKFSADSQWLIGLDVKILETLTLGIIFNDPRLYGLSIGLDGEKAKALAGLRFELLYKKITNDIGMFRVELRVPDAFRTIQLGVASLTLGIIVVEVYTNGNFKVDLGFPYNRDFSRAFSIEVEIYIGRGGIYFGYLNGDTSTQVPRITNGNFTPVLELGIGLAVGVGREISAGILSGGAYVELEVIFQGVLAWFHPNSSGAASAEYFSAKGLVAIHGKIYGSVDFVIIRVSVTLDAYAQALIAYECYQPILIELSVGVEAEAEVDFFFFSISFSFGVTLDLQFTVGSAQPTPWILAQGGDSSGASVGLSGPRRSARKLMRNESLRRAHLVLAERWLRTNRDLLTLGAGVSTSDSLHWNPAAKVFSDSPRPAHLTFLPLFTVGDVPVSWSDTPPQPAPSDTPRYRTAFVLCADTGIDPAARTTRQMQTRSAALSAVTPSDADTSTLAADVLVQGLMRYCFYAVPGVSGEADPKTISAWQIALILEEMKNGNAMATGFSIQNLETFFQTNIVFRISGDPGGEASTKGAMAVPVPPFLSWISAQVGNVNFSSLNKVGPLYEWGVSQALSSFFPVESKGGPAPTDDDPGTNYESYASFMFRDYCLMLAQAALTQAQKALDETTVTIQEENGAVWSLSQAASSLPKASAFYVIQAGNTLASVAAQLGATVEELEFLNPDLEHDILSQAVGTELSVELGVAPEVLALDNAGEPFVSGQWSLGTVNHQVGAGETLASIADKFNVTDLATILSYDGGNRVRLSIDPNLLQAGASIPLAMRTYTSAPADFTQARTAAAFYTRYKNPKLGSSEDEPDIPDWYAQAIAALNPGLSDLFQHPTILSTAEILPGQALSVPNSYQCAYLTAGNTNTYTTVPGDTLLRIGTTLALQQDFAATNPKGAPDWQTFKGQVTGSASSWSIPASTTAILPGSTVESQVRRLICDASYNATTRIWQYAWSTVAAWLGPAQVLAPLAVVPVPNAKTASGILSFAKIAQDYGVSIIDAAKALKGQAGLYAKGTVLAVKHLPAQEIDVLLNAVVQGDAFTAIVNQSSRMLMSGLQLPGLKTVDGHTEADTDHAYPVYDLTGQQFDLPVNATKPNDTALSLSVSSEVNWITFMNSIVVPAGTTLAQIQALETQYPDLRTYNPGIDSWTYPLAHALVLLTSAIPSSGTLDYSYTNDDVITKGPATTLAVFPASVLSPNPQAMKLAGLIPVSYGFEQRINLQTPVTLPIPVISGSSPVSGMPSLWPFPESFMTQRASGNSTPYEILLTAPDGKAGAKSDSIGYTTFGMLLPFRISRIDSDTTRFNLIGVDTDERQALLSLWAQMGIDPQANLTAAWLAVSPAPNAAKTSGITLLGTPAEGTYLIKTNLSTESVPQPPMNLARAAGTPPPPVYYATLASGTGSNLLRDFLLLLWEGSVVGGTGYVFGTQDPLPLSVFDEHGNATVQLLIIAGAQQQAAPAGRALLPFNNCLLVNAGLDASTGHLYAEAADGSETTAVALVPPGNAGFVVASDRPADAAGSSDAQEVMLRNLYSLLCFELGTSASGQSPFAAPQGYLPVMPNPWDGKLLNRMERDRAARNALRAGVSSPAVTSSASPQPYRRYDQVMPLYRFVKSGVAEAAAEVAGLPSPQDDPYRGLGLQTAKPNIHFSFGFGDLLGNRSAPPSAGEGELDQEAGYTDNLVSVGEWPNIAFTYEVVPASSPNPATLELFVAARPAALLPSPSQTGAASLAASTQQFGKYAQSYYQLIQGRMSANVLTTLKQVPDASGHDQGIAVSDFTPLPRFAAAAYAHALTIASMTPMKPGSATTLQGIMDNIPVDYPEIAEANADLPIDAIFAGTPKIPAYIAFVEHESFADLRGQMPAGWSSSMSDADLLALNGDLPLHPEVALVIPAQSISSGATQPTVSLATLASRNHTSVAVLVSEAGTDTAAILEPGFVFSVPLDDGSGAEASVTVDTQTRSFTQVVNAFAAQGVYVSLVDLAVMHQDDSGLLATDQTLSSTHYVAGDADTLAQNGSGQTLATLCANNTSTEDIFDPGALASFDVYPTVTLDNPAPTLRQLANRYACPMALLLSANATTSLAAETSLLIPGVLQFPAAPDTLRVPYGIQNGDSLTNIARNFLSANGSGGGADYLLAQANLNLPGTLIAGVTITLKGSPVVVEKNASFADVIKAVPGADLADLVTAITARTDVLQQGALFLCPPAQLPKACAPQDIAALYGCGAATFGFANTSTPGLIVAGQTLYDPSGNVSVLTKAGDTLNSIIVRFARPTDPNQKPVQVDAGGICAAPKNAAVPFLAQGALALLSPPSITLSVPVGNTGPYPGPVFPLQVSLRIARPLDLIHQDFKDADGNPIGIVQGVETAFPAPAKNGSTPEGSFSFNEFISDFTSALPNLRVGTAKVRDSSSDLWCVDFDAAGIQQVQLLAPLSFQVKGQSTQQPRYFAIKPLYNHLVSRVGIPIQPVDEQGKLGAAVLKNFQNVDVELWAERFLSDMDSILSPEYTASLYGNSASRSELTRILDSKQALMPLVAADLDAILDIADPGKASALASAKDTLKQQLGIGLCKAFEASLVIQYESDVQSAWQQPGTLQPAKFYGDGLIQDCKAALSITAAKVDLAQASSYSNFLVTVGDPAHHGTLGGSFAYDISHLEFNISSAGTPQDYVASDWLSFVPLMSGTNKPSALSGTDPGPLNAPVPLRVFPALPVIKAQAGEASYPDTGDIARIPLWTFALTYTAEHAEQDTVCITADFNLTRRTEFNKEFLDRDLFTELAQYMAVADPLANLLTGLSDPATAGNPSVQNAVASFADIANRVATSWDTRINPVQNSTSSPDPWLAAESYLFHARVTYRTFGEGMELDTYTLTLLPPATQPGPVGTWPGVEAIMADGTRVPLVASPPDPANTVKYSVPEGTHLPADGWPVIRVSWDSLNVSAVENARARLSVERNQNLVQDSPVATNPAFLFQTEEVTAAGITMPILHRKQPVDITNPPPPIPSPAPSVGTRLQEVLNTLFPDALADLKITVAISYAYELVPYPGDSSMSLVSSLPVSLYPKQPLSGDLGTQIESAINQWSTREKPNANGGAWNFSLILFASGANNERPLLTIDRMFYRTQT